MLGRDGYTVDGVSIVDNIIAGHIFDGVRVGPTATICRRGSQRLSCEPAACCSITAESRA